VLFHGDNGRLDFQGLVWYFLGIGKKKLTDIGLLVFLLGIG
jgi:hypothetical protein